MIVPLKYKSLLFNLFGGTPWSTLLACKSCLELIEFSDKNRFSLVVDGNGKKNFKDIRRYFFK